MRIAEAVLPEVEAEEHLSAQLTKQSIKTQWAESAWKNSELNLEVAKIALKEYTEGVVPQTRETLDGEIALAEAKIERLNEGLPEIKKIHQEINEAQGNYPADILARFQMEAILKEHEFAIPKEKLTLELANLKLKAFVEVERPKRVKELESEIAKADAEERAKRATLSLERQREAELRRQVLTSAPDPLRDRLQRAVRAAFGAELQISRLLEKHASPAEIQPQVDAFVAKLTEAEALLQEYTAKKEYKHFQEVNGRFP